MRVNKDHPQYAEYLDKCRRMTAMHVKQTDNLWKGTQGQDGNTELIQAEREYSRKLKELQKEYSILFR